MARKITKAERKAAHTNAAVLRSLRDGKPQPGGYIGAPPVYSRVTNPFNGVSGIVKTKPGIPYVRVS